MTWIPVYRELRAMVGQVLYLSIAGLNVRRGSGGDKEGP